MLYYFCLWEYYIYKNNKQCYKIGDFNMKQTTYNYYIVTKIMERYSVSKEKAIKLFRNTFLYKKVVDEILSQVNYLIANNIELI